MTFIQCVNISAAVLALHPVYRRGGPPQHDSICLLDRHAVRRCIKDRHNAPSFLSPTPHDHAPLHAYHPASSDSSPVQRRIHPSPIAFPRAVLAQDKAPVGETAPHTAYPVERSTSCLVALCALLSVAGAAAWFLGLEKGVGVVDGRGVRGGRWVKDRLGRWRGRGRRGAALGEEGGWIVLLEGGGGGLVASGLGGLAE